MALSREELRSVKLRNQNMRQMIYKEVKRPGRDHGRLFQMLRELHGPRHVRRDYISEVRRESRTADFACKMIRYFFWLLSQAKILDIFFLLNRDPGPGCQ